jgi:hypothetical protein
MTSLIPLLDPAGPPPHILQLYPGLELFSAGDPAANTLFVLGQGAHQPQLLLVDPPADAATRFRLEGDVAALFTGVPNEVGLPLVQTLAGGAGHLRIGDHFLDVYGLGTGAVVSLPAVGLVVAGDYGSDFVPPRVEAGSDGGEELETLRLLARLIKGAGFQLFVPRLGSLCNDKAAVMERLAADVGYLHGLRRVLPGLVARGEPLETVERIADSLLPEAWRTPAGLARHEMNAEALWG